MIEAVWGIDERSRLASATQVATGPKCEVAVVHALPRESEDVMSAWSWSRSLFPVSWLVSG